MQLEGMFDVPQKATHERRWKLDAPIDEFDWNVGLIVGPSGSGKTTIARNLFDDLVDRPLKWDGRSVVDNFPETMGVREITQACSAVGFNTIPSWMRPFHTLSNGEQFRVSLARRLSLGDEVCVVDEFTSVVDRQVAQIASHAVQKHSRRAERRFVAVTCHYDVLDWLQPDWVIDASLETFVRRSVQPRPRINVEISRVEYAAWRVFAPFHYMTSELNRSARCYALSVDGRLAAFAGVLARPISQGRNRGSYVAGLSRLVTLPDYQGLGLAFVLTDTLASAYKSIGKRFRTYPAHPALVASFGRSAKYAMKKRGGQFTSLTSGTGAVSAGGMGGRPNAVFEYRGPAMDDAVAAQRLLAGS